MIHEAPEKVKVLDIWKKGPAFTIEVRKFEDNSRPKELKLLDGKSNKIDYRRDK